MNAKQLVATVSADITATLGLGPEDFEVNVYSANIVATLKTTRVPLERVYGVVAKYDTTRTNPRTGKYAGGRAAGAAYARELILDVAETVAAVLAKAKDSGAPVTIRGVTIDHDGWGVPFASCGANRRVGHYSDRQFFLETVAVLVLQQIPPGSCLRHADCHEHHELSMACAGASR